MPVGNPMYVTYTYNIRTLYTKYSKRRRGEATKLSYKQFRKFIKSVWEAVILKIIHDNSVCYLPYKLGAVYGYLWRVEKGRVIKHVLTRKPFYYKPIATRGKLYRIKWDGYYRDLGANEGCYKFRILPKYNKIFKERTTKGGPNLYKRDPVHNDN